MKFGFLELIHGESKSRPQGYGHDIISNRLCAYCQKLKPAHQLTIFDSRIVIDIVDSHPRSVRSDSTIRTVQGATHILGYHFSVGTSSVFFASTLPRYRVSLHFPASTLPQSTCRTEVRHMKFGFGVDSGGIELGSTRLWARRYIK